MAQVTKKNLLLHNKLQLAKIFCGNSLLCFSRVHQGQSSFPSLSDYLAIIMQLVLIHTNDQHI